MRYSTEPRNRKHFEGYGFLSFGKKLEINMVNKLIYYRNEPNVSPDYNTDPMTNYASFEYQSSIIGKTPNNNNNDYDSDDNEKRC